MADDTIFLSALQVQTVIGIFDWEREAPQTVSIDLELPADAARAARSDAIEATLDYKTIAKRVIGFVEAAEFQLIETLAEGIAGLVLEDPAIAWVRVCVEKPGAIRGARTVGVRIERRRS